MGWVFYSQQKWFSVWLNFPCATKHTVGCKLFSQIHCQPKQTQPYFKKHEDVWSHAQGVHLIINCLWKMTTFATTHNVANCGKSYGILCVPNITHEKNPNSNWGNPNLISKSSYNFIIRFTLYSNFNRINN